jgi:hypothetical protein
MQREITAGGRLSIAFSIAWALSWLPFFLGDWRSSKMMDVGRSVSAFVIVALSTPLGWMSGVLGRQGGAISPGEAVCFLVLSGGNFFFLGYGAVGIWRLFRRVFGPFPPVEYERISKAKEALVDVGNPPETEDGASSATVGETEANLHDTTGRKQ